MRWWNRLPKPLGSFLLGFFGTAVIVIIALVFLGPIVGNVFCTLADYLGDGVFVNFVGYMPDNYTVSIYGFPSGRREIICSSAISADQYEFSATDQCTPNGVFFEQIDSQEPSDTPPVELTVEVVFEGNKISKTFHPEYEIIYPNGERCAPMAYRTTIEFELPQ